MDIRARGVIGFSEKNILNGFLGKKIKSFVLVIKRKRQINC